MSGQTSLTSVLVHAAIFGVIVHSVWKAKKAAEAKPEGYLDLGGETMNNIKLGVLGSAIALLACAVLNTFTAGKNEPMDFMILLFGTGVLILSIMNYNTAKC